MLTRGNESMGGNVDNTIKLSPPKEKADLCLSHMLRKGQFRRWSIIVFM